MKRTPKPIRYACIDTSLLLGESVVRRIISEKKHYIKEPVKEPAYSIIPHSLGYSRGIVQLLSDSGSTNYFLNQLNTAEHSLPEIPFEWIGFDGSSVIVNSAATNYESGSGQGDELLLEIKKTSAVLPKFRGDLNPSADDLFKSMNRLKPALFNLEHKYYTAEKLFSIAATSGLMDYPVERMNDAMDEILFCQSYRTPGENNTDNAESIVIFRIVKTTWVIDEMIAALIMHFGDSFKKPSPGENQILVLNPHPFKVDTIALVEIEIDKPDLIYSGSNSLKLVDDTGVTVPSQCENTEASISGENIGMIAFRVTVPAGSTKCYSFSFDKNTSTSRNQLPETDLIFKNERSKLVFDRKTGFPSVYEYDGNQLLGSEKMSFTIEDESSDQIYPAFKGPVRISEYGPVRTILESSFIFSNSQIHVRYLIPENDPYFDIEIKVIGIDESKILKFSIPVSYNMNCVGRAISGITCSKHRNREFVFRDWLGMKNFEGDTSLSLCAKGAYSYDIDKNTVRIRLLTNTDNPSNTFSFRFYPGSTGDVIDMSFNNSDLFNNPVIASQIFTKGDGGQTFRGIIISDRSINLQAVKLNENGDIVLRLLNPCKETIRFTIEIPSLSLVAEIEIGSRKLKTLIVEKNSGRIIETDLLERKKS